MFVFDKLTFRKLGKDDLPVLLHLKNESWQSTHQVSFLNYTDQSKWFENLDSSVHSPRNLILVATYENSDVGVWKMFNIDWISRCADCAWDIFSYKRGKGLGKILVKAGTDFSFQVMNLRRLNAEILVNNEASLKCARYAGWILEGFRQKAIWKPEGYVDSFFYGIMKNGP